MKNDNVLICARGKEPVGIPLVRCRTDVCADCRCDIHYDVISPRGFDRVCVRCAFTRRGVEMPADLSEKLALVGE